MVRQLRRSAKPQSIGAMKCRRGTQVSSVAPTIGAVRAARGAHAVSRTLALWGGEEKAKIRSHSRPSD